MTSDVLESFSTPVRDWFRRTFGELTPPQQQGWPPIQRGEHTLILAPTGSGKTLTAFLSALNDLYVNPDAEPTLRVIYVSPLKALNNDIERNLRGPLQGIRQTARELEIELPRLSVAVRTGDTPQSARRAMLKTPPHILITTPESLYLMLTGSQMRSIFRQVRTVIVDEIHTLAGNKRGVHLALSLERLQRLAEGPIQRIGLSATIRPLEEVARFLGGQEIGPGDAEDAPDSYTVTPRPVTIVDAHYHKALDVQVVTVVEDFRHLQGESIWPRVTPHVLDLVRQHETTLIFCNSRIQAERTAERLNDLVAAEEGGTDSHLHSAHTSRKAANIGGTQGSGSVGPFRAHHGSTAKEVRLELERKLKAGELPALIGTSSLELGIDIGSIDLVVQLQACKSVAQALQRAGRSGHLVGQTSKFRLFPTFAEDLIQAAAVAGGMLRGEVEPTYTPRAPLDVLAQQIVAMVSVEDWDVEVLYRLVRQCYAYRDLSRRAFISVLEMLSGKYSGEVHRELRPRLSWDRVNNQLHALPGSRLLALTNGGTIPDRGAFGAYLPDGKTRIGELDEEFVYESRPGDVFVLGSQVWRALEITQERVVVAPAGDAVPRMPFWRGDFPWRAYRLGCSIGAFRGQLADRLQQVMTEISISLSALGVDEMRELDELKEVWCWLQADFALDDYSAANIIRYVAHQLEAVGAISSDRTILVELFRDALGDPRLVVHAPFGGRVNGPWGLALASAFRERTGVDVEMQTNDDGVLLRFPDADQDPPLDVVARMGPEEVRERILRELPNSALFGAQFRMNAQRALLLPGRPGRRTPFWLQRLRARDLLQITTGFADFPIVMETYRDCLQDVADMAALEEVLVKVRSGEIEVVAVETVAPSPVAAGLLFNFIAQYMYEWDAPKAEKQLQALSLNRELLADVLRDVSLADLLKPEAITEVEERLQRTATAQRARSVEEAALLLYEMGDLTTAEVAARSAGGAEEWLAALAAKGRVLGVSIPTANGGETRWISQERTAEYQAAFGLSLQADEPTQIETEEARRAILQRFLRQSGPTTPEAIRARYGFPVEWLECELQRLASAREVVSGRFSQTEGTQYIDRRNLEQIHRRTLTLLRREIKPVSLYTYADFLTRWQHLHPSTRLTGPGGLRQVLSQLRDAPMVGRIWERDALPTRLHDFRSANLDALCQGGELIWVATDGKDPRRTRFRCNFRGEGSVFLEEALHVGSLGVSEEARQVYDFLKAEGAAFFADLTVGLQLPTDAIEAGLVELVLAGLVTNDTMQGMREIIERGSAILSPQQAQQSSLQQELARRLAERKVQPIQRPGSARYREAKRRVVQRLQAQGPSPLDERARSVPGEAPYEAPRWVGRWSLVHRMGVLGPPVAEPERALRQVRQLLQRYGILTRSVLEAEEGPWDWGALYEQLRRMEIRGEVRRGYFVEGLSGVQFGLPEAVEQLREAAATDDDDLVVINACDVANIFPPDVATRIPSNYLVLWRGQPVLVSESGGAALRTTEGADDGVVRQALQALLGHLSRSQRKISVTTWNDQPVLGSEGQSLLESVGFYRDYPGMTWRRL